MAAIKLPPGNWQVRTLSEEAGVVKFVAECDRPPDRVHGTLRHKDLGGDSYTLDMWGLPEDIDLESMWYLHHMSYRDQARASGGSIAVLKSIAQWADEGGIWLISEAADGKREVQIINALQKYGGFRNENPMFSRLLVRAPASAPRSE